jgi:hypothetical protein
MTRRRIAWPLTKAEERGAKHVKTDAANRSAELQKHGAAGGDVTR